MPFGEVRLIPGVNVERTPTLLETGYAASSLGRFKDGLFQKYGGWQKFYATAVAGTPRELHAWQDLNGTNHLAVGTTTQFGIITGTSYTDITPQTLTTNPAPNFTTAAGSATITVNDSGVTTLSVYDAVLFDTPIAVDGLILSGLYAVNSVLGSGQYTIIAAANAVAGVANGGAVPQFTTTSGSATVTVTFAAHGQSVGATVVFPVATTGNGVTISGAYTVATAATNSFTIAVAASANASSSFNMNSGNAQFVYSIALGPPQAGSGFGIGGFGAGGFGTGTTFSQQTGTEITATDWACDNWGKIILGCPQNGAVYQWDPNGGFSTAAIVATAPPFNGGIFVSISQQILVCWGSTATKGIGIIQDPLLVKWSTVSDFTNFVPLPGDQAGSYRIPVGSAIMGGGAVANQNLIWTDLDLWAMNYQGLPFVYGFNKIGAGSGLISSHAWQQLRGAVYWMGPSNFYSLTGGGGVQVMPCSVWDAVFQNLNSANVANIRAMPNTPFNEVGWEYPSAASTGENDSYVKYNIVENAWDYGPLARSAWIDQTVLGNPIGATPGGIVYQHETTNDADGAPLAPAFTTGYFYLAEGEDFAFVDQVIPDMKWGTFAGSQSANVQLSFNVLNYPGDSPVTYGPYSVTQSTEYLSVRFRGRQMSITAQSSDLSSFWRLGKVRYRYAQAGRR